jgi:uncharacterized protein
MVGSRVTLRFFSDLATLAAYTDRAGETEVTFDVPRAVKDAIESCGVPHTEVALVLVDGTSVGFEHRLTGGEHVAVYPHFSRIPVKAVSKVEPEPLPAPRFVADVHLGRLAEKLRLLGFDTLYRNDYDDDELVRISVADARWLLTRDRGLLMRSAVTHGYLLRSDDPTEQVVEVLRRFDLAADAQPFRRCARCNGLIEPVDKAEVIHLLERGTRERHDEFTRCGGCGQVYWGGSHMGSLDPYVDEVLRRGSHR